MIVLPSFSSGISNSLFKPSNIPNLVLWLDAGNIGSYSSTGTEWKDLSGNNRHFNWSTTPSFINDGVRSYFTTLGNRCTGPASNSFGIDNTSGYTIFLICMQNTLNNTGAFKFYRAGQIGSVGRGIFSHCTWGNDIVYFDQGGCCGSDTRTQNASGGSQTWNIWTFRRFTNSSTRSISKNGATLTTNTDSAATIDLDNRAVDVGGADEYVGTWDARLNSFYVYNRGLSDDEILQNYKGLKGRFNL